MSYIDKKIDQGNGVCSVDFSTACQYFTMDVITDMAFGEPFGYLAQDKDLHDYHKILAEGAPAISAINSMPTLSRFMNRDLVKKLWAPTTKDTKGFGKLMAYGYSPTDEP